MSRSLWTAGEVDNKLHNIMQSIHHACVHYGEENGRINYVKGANIAGFVKVADACTVASWNWKASSTLPPKPTWTPTAPS